MRKKWLVVSGQGAVILICMILCHSFVAEAGWFVPENRIAWQSWHNGDDMASLKHWDHSSKGIYGRATVLMRMGRLREAEREFRQSLDSAAGLEPEYIASIWYNLGNCLYAEGALKQAREAWHQALQYNPEHVKAAHNLAVAGDLLKRGREQAVNMHVPSRLTKKPRGKKPQKQGGDKRAENGLPTPGKNTKTHKRVGDGEEGNAVSMSRAEREVDGVRDAMDVFLRHRLAEKAARTVAARRGPPW